MCRDGFTSLYLRDGGPPLPLRGADTLLTPEFATDLMFLHSLSEALGPRRKAGHFHSSNRRPT